MNNVKHQQGSDWSARPLAPCWVAMSTTILWAIASGGVEASTPPTPAANAERSAGELLQGARALMDNKQYDAALATVQQVLQANASDPAAVALRAELYRRSDRLDDARSDYDLLTRLRPNDADAWFWIATIDRWHGKQDDALREYTKAIELAPCHGDALKGRARVRRSSGDTEGSEADLRKAMECYPKDTEAAGLLSDSLTQRGQEKEAEAMLRTGFTGAELEGQLGRLALSGGHLAEAQLHYGAALQAAPDNTAFLRGTAEAQRRRGRTGDALDTYQRISKLDVDDTEALYWIGVLATRTGDRDEAMAAFDSILSRRPGDAGALVGKARLLRDEGRTGEAIECLDRAIASAPDSGEARTLRASILASSGKAREARDEYREALRRHPDDQDARVGLVRLGPDRGVELTARSNRTDVVEGLDEEGLQVEGFTIRPTRIRYLTEGGGASVSWTLGDSLEWHGQVSSTREAVTSLSHGFTIYDFDVLAASVGLDHQIAPGWALSWRVGGSRYDPRKSGTIATDSHFAGSIELERRIARSRFTVNLSRLSFIQRGFAGDFQFRIFDQNRLSATWDQSLRRGFALAAWASLSDFSDGNTPFSASLALGWSRGDRSLTFRYRHDPFTARFFGPDLHLDFIDFDAASVYGRTPLPWKLSLSSELLAGYYGATNKTIYVDTDGDGIPNRVSGPLDHNFERMLRARLDWTPAPIKIMTVGAEYLSDHYDFNTGPYNTINVHSWSLFAEFNGGLPGRWSYTARYARGLLGDERDNSYASNTYLGRLDANLGRPDRESGPMRVSIEGQYKDNDLNEKLRSLRGLVTIPF